jgi:uncharacterized membrane protein YbhN (UPF0104 family)
VARTGLTLAVVAVVGLVLLWQRALVDEVLVDARGADRRWLALLVGGGVAHYVAHAGLFRRSVENGVSWGRAALGTQAGLGLSNLAPGCGSAAQALRAGMLHSWGVPAPHVAASLGALTVVPGISMWSLVAAGAGVLTVTTPGADIWLLLTVAATVSVAVQVAAVTWAVRRPTAARWIARLTSRPASLLARRGPRRVRDGLADIDLPTLADHWRRRAGEVFQTQRWRLVAWGLGVQLSLALCFVASVYAMGATQVPWWELLAVFAAGRAATAVSPLQGGLGVVDLGLAAMLRSRGVDDGAIAAALVLHRGVTFLPPLPIGGVSILVWRRAGVRAAAVAHAGAVAVSGPGADVPSVIGEADHTDPDVRPVPG